MKEGYVQVYTGDGKGKTTAVFGLALRSVCAGFKVYIGQFLKGMKYGEAHFVHNEPSEKDIARANEGLNKLKKSLCPANTMSLLWKR